MSQDAIQVALLAENGARCAPPLSEDEVQRIAASVARYPPAATSTTPPPAPLPAASLVVVSLADVQPEHVSWLWPGRIPLGKLTVLDGDPGLGKSLITVDLAARITTYQAMPDGARSDLPGPAAVVFLSAEDGLADTIAPRLITAGADLARVDAITDVYQPPREDRAEDGEDGVDRAPSVPRDVALVEQLMAKRGARLLIVDPLMAYLGGEVNTHRDQDIRLALTPLAKLAERAGAAVLVVRHLNKGSGASPLYRGGGSIGIIGAARSALLVAKDPDAPESGRCVLAPLKGNLARPAPALIYRVEESAGGVPRVVWEGESTHTAAALLAMPADEGERGAREEAMAFLRETLAAAARPVEDVKREARQAGIADSTLRRAKDALRVRSHKQGFGAGAPWVWELPGADVPIPIDAHDPPIGAHPQGVSTYGQNEHLWGQNGHAEPGAGCIADAMQTKPGDGVSAHTCAECDRTGVSRSGGRWLCYGHHPMGTAAKLEAA